ncbi:sensor histidine kinase response [Diplodia corticola]|uniref:histidine kinase n=1 Tax=Diplodia corticola TaxID=236234 RepID=A0A1J9RC55_9PEZI|nr:sensor histidine kinase response [Diplodia corticola]OJD38041.1 sensor histidine kinase response [Diplodia corticola]
MTAATRSCLAAERARESDLCFYYPPSLSIPDLRAQLDTGPGTNSNPSSAHVPRPSTDLVLTALAQLGALRLNAANVLVSLVDSQSQIVLAEATPNMSLTGPADALWLGSAVIPREYGVCECVLDEPAVVVNDLLLDARFHARPFVRASPQFRFYAGIPLKAPTGSVIGVYAIFDTSPRDGLAETELLFLQDVAAAVVSYLGVSKAHDTNRNSEHMIRGLASFVTGAADLEATADLDVPRAPENPSVASPLPARTPATQDKSPPSDEPQGATPDEDPPTLQDSILPSGAKRMFSRAANIMRESSALSGVIFFDASMANVLPTGATPPQTSSDDSDAEASTALTTSTAEESSGSNLSSTSSGPSIPTCKILGFADASRSSRDGSRIRKDYLMLTETSLRKFLTRHPHGKIFNIARQATDDVPVKRSRRGKTRRSTAVDAIIDVAHNARSAAIIPLWDYNRQRWFAGCLCWVTDPRRELTYGSDLLFLRAFGHSIMAEMGRIDAAAVDKARTTFIESMSHELRSPLHGILGAAEYLQSMRLDTFQANVVYSIAMCGRTLLDTVQNVLEYSKINEFTGPYAKSATSAALRLRRSSIGPIGSNPTVDLRRLTEETVEAIFAGQSYNFSTPQPNDDEDYFSDPPTSASPRSKSGRKPVRVVLDLPNRHSWAFAIQPGIWRRILMNVFGNALRFTETGFVRVALSANDVGESESELLLTITDSGVGMSSKYVQDGLFKPFSQENSFSAGTGLGMSIVQRLVQSLGGEITVKSKVQSGTTVQIRMVLPSRVAIADDDFEDSVTTRARGRNVTVIKDRILEGEETRDVLRASERQFHDCLTDSLKAWFGVNVANSRDSDDASSRLVIYPGPSFHALYKAGKRRGVTVIVAIDGVEAATLRTDPRIKSGWIEVVTQPCGPSKLARILDRYMSRLDPESNAPLRPDISKSPRPGVGTTVMSSLLHCPSPSSARAAQKSNDLETIPQQTPKGSVHEPSQPPYSLKPSESVSSDSSLGAVTPPSSSRSSHIYHHRMHNEMVGKQKSLLAATSAPPPASSSEAAASDPSSFTLSLRHRSRSSKEILIVDDNPLNLRLLSAFLTKAGFHRHTSALNGLEALNMFKKQPARWAAILMDISMPVMDGVTATQEIRAWERRVIQNNSSGQPGAMTPSAFVYGGGSDDGDAKKSPATKRSAKDESKEAVKRWSKGAAGAPPPDVSSPALPAPQMPDNGIVGAPSSMLPDGFPFPREEEKGEKEEKEEKEETEEQGQGKPPPAESTRYGASMAPSVPLRPAAEPDDDTRDSEEKERGEDGQESEVPRGIPSSSSPRSSLPSRSQPSDKEASASIGSSSSSPPHSSFSAESPSAVLETPTPKATGTGTGTGPATASVLAAHGRVQIIVITGLGSATARFEAMHAGADVFMTKPIKFGVLMKTLKGRIGG